MALTLHPSLYGATTPLKRIKRLTSYTAHSRFLAECDDTSWVIARRDDIPSPYSYSPEWPVYAYKGQHIIISETMHKRYDVFVVPQDLLRAPQD